MGYQYQVDYRLTFDDPSMEGFECVMREPTVDEMLEVTEALFGQAANAREKVYRRTELMASHIVSWNLADPDNPSLSLPMTAKTIMAQGKGFSIQLTAAWLREVVGLTIPPAQPSEPSPDGFDSALVALPMESPAGEPEQPA